MEAMNWILGNVSDANPAKAEAVESEMMRIEAQEEAREARKAALSEADERDEEHAEEHAGSFREGAQALRFMLAGRARLTLVSSKTGARFTYRVRSVEEGGPWFVSVLTGSNNEADYTFLGTIFPKAGTTPRYFHGRKSRIAAEAPSAKAFAWAAGYLLRGQLPPGCEVHHEGRCGKCGRALTVPESIATGLGPVCAAGGLD